jgi:pilus assembly protein Flp/PilA
MLFLPRAEGQGLAEYAMVIGLVAVVIVAILTVFGPQVGNMFSRVTRGFVQ